MTVKELNKIFKGSKLVYFRAGADSITESTPRKAKAIIKEMIEFDEEIVERFTRLGEIVFIDSPSWVEINK